MIYEFGKRLLDIVGALVGIILFSPIMLAACIFIKVVSPEGPILADTPKRIGLNKKPFKFLKFRSMIPNAQNWLDSHPEYKEKYLANNFKLDPDPRLITGGKFMRKSSIDELPQFFNVLIGDMSIVGPRAYYPFEIDQQLQKSPEVSDLIDIVLSVKPGITGAWQIGGRSKVGFSGRVSMDAEYAKRRSILYDLIVILKTPYVVITGKGAY